MYRELDDNEILYMIEENNDNYAYLIQKYRPLVIKICQNYLKEGKELGYEFDDLIQVANMGIMDAVNTYLENKNVLFYTYMVKCIKNKIRNELRNQNTNKNITLNKAISYDKIVPGTVSPLIEVIPDGSSPDPFQSLIEKEIEIKYINFLNRLPLETAIVFEMKQEGFADNQIEAFTKLDNKTVAKYFRNAKKELKNLLTSIKKIV